ncbi:SusC/RagA family TonB-linked outer membrane protein [Flavisolibacter ginsenosidimutans]|nr:TonB-dependent receptor [Flavisolibacter ginsenosidimutans]
MLIILPTTLFAQNTIKGVITDGRTNTPLAGVNVTVKGAGKGTQTNAAGEYTISARSSDVLQFSYAGYETHEVPVQNQTNINYTLKESTSKLDEVVVVGYGTTRRKDLTGAVASVNGKSIAATPVPNIAQAMQGKLAGVNVVSQDGRPGADVSIRVRGGGSISQSNQPLILIDGVPGSLSDVPPDQVKSIDVLKDASSTAIYGARGANGVVLVTTKGAQAGKTTITYNGYVKFNTPAKYLKALSPYDYLKYVWANAAANGTAYRTPFEQLYGIGAFTTINTGGIESYRNLASDDIQKQVYHSSTSSNHDLTITGGTDKTKILFSTSYSDEQGMKINSFFKRGNVAFKLSQKLFDNLTFNLDTRYTDIQNKGDEGTTNGFGSLLSTAYEFRPISTAHILGDLNALRTGNIQQYGTNVMWDTHSPVARISDYDPLSLSQSMRGIASLDWKIIKDVTYHTDFFLSRSWSQQKHWSGATYNNYLDDATNTKLYAGAVDYRKNDAWGLRWTNTLNYALSVGTNHHLNLLAGQEVANSGGTGIAIQANHFPANFTEETAFAQINQYDQTNGSATFSSSVSTPDRLLSYFGRANYSFLDRYLLTATFRADGSSRFTPAHQWGYFPAGAIAWRMSEESFLKDVKWLNDLKLRASYGAVGNDRIPSSSWTQLWGSVSDQRFQYAINHQRQSAYDLASQTLANPNLKWETTITRNVGTDFTLFKFRLSGTVDVYWNTTKDLLMLTSNPPVSGYPLIYSNIGQTSNKGVELSLSGTIFENKDWKITAGGNINFNKSNVDKLAPNVTGLYSASWSGSQSYPASDYVLLEGKPVGLVRGLTYDGLYTPADFDYNNGLYTLKKGVSDLGNFIGVVHGIGATDKPSTQYAYPGLPKFKDLNGDGKIDENDVSVIGNMNPKHTGGFNLGASFKNIDFGLYFNWSVGNQIYNANKLATLYGPKEAGVYENKLAIMKDAYKIYDVVNGQLVRLTTPDQLNAANANATLPLAYNEVGVTSTLGIEDGSYLRLNTLNLGYTLPKSILAKVKISNLRIYGSVYNVFTITKYSGLDPEVNTDPSHNNATYPTTGFDFGTYPRPRSYVVGLNVSF